MAGSDHRGRARLCCRFAHQRECRRVRCSPACCTMWARSTSWLALTNIRSSKNRRRSSSCCATGTPTSARPSWRTASFPEHIAEAIGEHENIERINDERDVTDVLTVAVMMFGFFGHETDLELNMQGVKSFWRLGLDNTKCVHVMRDCADEISALRTAARRLTQPLARARARGRPPVRKNWRAFSFGASRRASCATCIGPTPSSSSRRP